MITKKTGAATSFWPTGKAQSLTATASDLRTESGRGQ